MSEFLPEQSHIPFPEIARLPGERKLEGVPHKASESIFNQFGVPEALSLHTETFGLNSAGRALVMNRYLGRNPKVENIERTIAGLDAVKDDFDNPVRSTHANFLAVKLRDKAGALAASAIRAESTHDSFYNDERNRPSYEMFTTQKRREIIEAAETEPYRPDQNPFDDPDLRLEVSRLVRQKNCPDDEIIALGYRLAHRFISPDLSPVKAAHIFAELAIAIDLAKIKAVGRKTSTVISNQIIWAAITETAFMLPHTNHARAEIRQARQNLGLPENYANWLYPKFDMLDSDMYKQQQLDIYISRYKEGVSGKLFGLAVKAQSKLESQQFVEQDAGTELAAELIRLKRYTVKPAYFAGVTSAKLNDESWVFTPADTILGAGWDGTQRKLANPFLAHVDLASNANPETLVGEQKTLQYGNKSQLTYLAKADFDPRLILGIYPDGEIGFLSGGNIRDIRERFVSADREEVYSTLQLTLLKNLFDLVVPVEVIEGLPGHEAGPKNSNLFGKLKEAVEQTPIRDLVLARVKYIREHRAVVQDLIDKENDTSQRELRDHAVVGHIRRLPPGFKPTPDAIALAESLGFKLAPNETFVRDHRRGSVENGSITSHRAVQVRSKVGV